MDKWKLPPESSAKWSRDAVGGNGLSLITVFVPCRCRLIRFPAQEEYKLLKRLLHSDSNSAMSGSAKSATARRQINSTTLSEDDLHPNPLLRTNPDPNFRSQNRRVVFCPSARFHRNLSVQDKLNMVLAQQWEPRTIKHPGSSIASQSLEDRRFAGDPPEPLL